MLADPWLRGHQSSLYLHFHSSFTVEPWLSVFIRVPVTKLGLYSHYNLDLLYYTYKELLFNKMTLQGLDGRDLGIGRCEFEVSYRKPKAVTHRNPISKNGEKETFASMFKVFLKHVILQLF